ncbi:MAG TPA: carboxypeptidase-like regulatory domain-containing protein [Vicinamibacterales bacterium]|nr:carboxypeptidase-like regulatory domain-containing protein [Vicinamibacterales bacterium]
MAPISRSIRRTLLAAAAAAAAAVAVAMPLVHAQVSMGAAQEVRIVGDVRADGPLPPGFGGPPPAPMAGGTGLILGQAIDGLDATRGIAGALVTLTLGGSQPVRVLADGQGRFAFRDLPKGRFNITASRPGYVDGAYGRLRPSGQAQSVDLGDGDRVSNVNVALWKYAAVGGTLLDESGDPIIGASVRVLRRQIVAGKPKLTPGAMDATDDRGMYRIGQLEPGDYLVVVPMSQAGPAGLDQMLAELGARDIAAIGGGGGRGGGTFTFTSVGPGAPIMVNGVDVGASATPGVAYPTQFYPTAASASRATSITLNSGEERTGLDFNLKPVRTQRVAGVVSGPEGPATNLMVNLVPADAEDLISPVETLTAMTDGSGAFTFAAVPPGQYVLRASRNPRGNVAERMISADGGGQVIAISRIAVAGGPAPPLPTEQMLWSESAISVGTNDVANLAIIMRPGAKVSGALDFSGGAQRPNADQLGAISVTLEPADGRNAGAARGRVDAAGSFTTVGVMPGKYFLKSAGAPQGWTFKGATIGGRDITDAPFEIEGSDVGGVVLTFTDRPSALAGTVTGSSGGGTDPQAAVIIFPAERELWTSYGTSPRRLRNVRADTKGAYTISNVPPGRYYVAAVREALAAEWQDPKFLETLANEATPVTIGEGQQMTQALKVVR